MRQVMPLCLILFLTSSLGGCAWSIGSQPAPDRGSEVRNSSDVSDDDDLFEAKRRARAEGREAPRSLRSSSSSAYPTLGAELRDLEAARREGVLTDDEFESAKRRLLDSVDDRNRR